MPGRVKDVSPTCPLEMPNSLTIGRKGRCYARSPEDRHQRHAPQNVEVVVSIDPANAPVSHCPLSHDRRIYRVVRFGGEIRHTLSARFGLRLSARSRMRKAEIL
jgi:hypothetical protein